MKTANNSRAKSFRSRGANSEYRKEEIEMINRAIQECKAKGTSTYVTVNGRTYLVTPHGVMSYDGTATVAYSQSQKCREMDEKVKSNPDK